MKRHTTRTCILVTIFALTGVASAEAQWVRTTHPTSQLRFRFGLFEPAGDSDGWDRVFEGFTGDPADLQDFVWGSDFILYTSPHTGILFGGSYYRGRTTSAYTDWETADGYDIRHTTTLEISDLNAAFVFYPTGGPVRPYLGAGAGLLWYTLVDEGEFIDFGAPGQPVFWGWYGTQSSTFEAFALAGIDIPVSVTWSIIFEGRYRWAEDTLGDDFSGFGDLDLSGYELSGGFAFRF